MSEAIENLRRKGKIVSGGGNGRAFTPRSAEINLGNPIMQGMQDNGRIYRTEAGLIFVSDGFSSFDQDEIQRLMERHQAGMPRSAFPEEMEARRSMQTTGGATAATLEKASQGLPFVGEFIFAL